MSSVGVSLLKAGVELRPRLHSEYVLYGAELVLLEKKYVWKLLDRGEATKDDVYLGQIASSFSGLRKSRRIQDYSRMGLE